MRAVRILSAVAAFGTFVVFVLGKIVRLTGASTSIPDWPLAFGQLIPSMTPLVFWEWTHRLSVLIVFLTMVALTLCAVRVPGKLWQYCLMSLGLLVIPAIFGGVSILYRLNVATSTLAHAFELLYFASIVGLAVWSRSSTAAGSDRPH